MVAEFSIFNIAFGFLDYYINFQDHKTPVKPFLNQALIKGSLESVSTENFAYRMFDFNSDNGWIFEDYDITHYYQFDQRFLQFSTSKTVPYVNAIIFNISNIKEIYSRSYVKVQTVLANTGGIIKLLLLIGITLNTYFAEIDLFVSIHSALDDESKPLTGDSSSNINFVSLFQSDFLSQVPRPTNNNMQLKNRNDMYKGVRFSFWQKFILIFSGCCVSNSLKVKYKYYNEMKQKIIKYYEIHNTIKLHSNLNKIKNFKVADRPKPNPNPNVNFNSNTHASSKYFEEVKIDTEKHLNHNNNRIVIKTSKFSVV